MTTTMFEKCKWLETISLKRLWLHNGPRVATVVSFNISAQNGLKSKKGQFLRKSNPEKKFNLRFIHAHNLFCLLFSHFLAIFLEVGLFHLTRFVKIPIHYFNISFVYGLFKWFQIKNNNVWCANYSIKIHQQQAFRKIITGGAKNETIPIWKIVLWRGQCSLKSNVLNKCPVYIE